jgi:hypothetical protein
MWIKVHEKSTELSHGVTYIIMYFDVFSHISCAFWVCKRKHKIILLIFIIHSLRNMRMFMWLCAQYVLTDENVRSLVKKSPTKCSVYEYHREASTIGRPWPPRGCCAMDVGEGEKLLNISNNFSPFITVRMAGL